MSKFCFGIGPVFAVFSSLATLPERFFYVKNVFQSLNLIRECEKARGQSRIRFVIPCTPGLCAVFIGHFERNTVMNKKTSTFSLFIKYAERHRGRVALLTIVYLAGTTLLVLAPQALSFFIDSIQGGSPWSAVLLAVLLYLGAELGRTAMMSALDVQISSVGQRITDDYRRDVMAHYLSLDMQTLGSFTSGEIVTRLDEDVEGLFKYYYIVIYKLAGSGLALIWILIALGQKSGWLCAALMVASALSILAYKMIQDRGIPKQVKYQAASAAFNGKMKEMLDNAETLRAVRSEAYADTEIRKAMKIRYRDSFPAGLMYGNLWSAATIVECVIVTTGLAFALGLWDQGAVTIGMVYLIYTYSDMIVEPLQDFRNHMGDMQGAKAGILRTEELMNMEVTADGGETELPKGPLALNVRNISFSYGNKKVLDAMNLNVAAGGRLGIMGETGCGKSTLISLIARLNAYTDGEICIGGAELKSVSLKSLRERVAYCSQQVQLIHGTMRDNIGLFQHSDAEIQAAVERLGLTEWFEKYGLGYRLEMAGGSLSSGEAQLITLVRLALKKPGLVLLDEITASLDPVTERRITRAVEALCESSTVVAIAHNAEALDWMERVVRMEQGRIFQE